MKTNLVIFAAALCLAACASNTWSGMHDAAHLQATAVNFNASTGATAGYIGGTIDRAPVTDKDGHALAFAANDGVCARSAAVVTFTNMHSKASAQASNVPAGQGGITSPQLAVATGDVSANGGAAIVAAAASSAHPADVIAAYCNNVALPSAPANSVVRDGMTPTPPAP